MDVKIRDGKERKTKGASKNPRTESFFCAACPATQTRDETATRNGIWLLPLGNSLLKRATVPRLLVARPSGRDRHRYLDDDHDPSRCSIVITILFPRFLLPFSSVAPLSWRRRRVVLWGHGNMHRHCRHQECHSHRLQRAAVTPRLPRPLSFMDRRKEFPRSLCTAHFTSPTTRATIIVRGAHWPAGGGSCPRKTSSCLRRTTGRALGFEETVLQEFAASESARTPCCLGKISGA